jgi:Mrp family chromosome partitioning ATPase
MSEILDEIKQEFEVIILDGPPFIVADAAVLANKSDGVLWVMRPGVTRRDALKITKEQLTRAHARILGVVINDANLVYNAYSEYYSQEKRS